MNATIVRGNIKQAKGKLKQVIGYLTNNKRLLLKGIQQEVAGKIQEKYGRTKDIISHRLHWR